MDATQFDLANHSVKDTIKLVTFLLEKISRGNDRLYLTEGKRDTSSYTDFHARTIPTISIYEYFMRILKYCPCANECFIALLVYFDRMTQESSSQRPSLHVDSYNIHRLIITGLMISSKLYSDIFFTNTRYAKVGGLPVAELNALEIEFLYMNEYNVFIPIDVLQEYADNLIAHCSFEKRKSMEIKNRQGSILLDRLSISHSTSNRESPRKHRYSFKRDEEERASRRASAPVRADYE
ncbi:cyclin-domain-containing protein [Sporodiniella umbellata]|nr:cyclin-domain-containing protein [Sporodiniella umbellata]